MTEDEPSDRFAKLAELDRSGKRPDQDDATPTESDDESHDSHSSSDSDDSTDSVDADESDRSDATDESGSSDATGEEGGPAFAFTDDLRQSVYVREENWEAFTDTVEFEVKPLLHREYGIRDLTGREVHDAMARLAAEREEDIVRLVAEARDLEADED